MRRFKKILPWAVVAVAAVMVAGLAIVAKNYYEDRYVGTDHYAIVPRDYDMSPQPVYSRDGVQVGTGVEYKLTAFDSAGRPQVVSFTVFDPGSPISRGEQQPQPGTYLQISASNQLVVSWRVVTTAEIPAQALAAIRAQ